MGDPHCLIYWAMAKQDDEFLTVPVCHSAVTAPDHVMRADMMSNDLGGFHQPGVAQSVAVAIVDRLEMIEIYQDHAERNCSIVCTDLQRQFLEGTTIVEAGQAVTARQILRSRQRV